jgi:hypothetical protein
MVKDNGSGWILKQGRVILAHPKHRENRFAVRLPFPRHDYSPPILESLQLINISMRKAEAGSSLCLSISVI